MINFFIIPTVTELKTAIREVEFLNFWYNAYEWIWYIDVRYEDQRIAEGGIFNRRFPVIDSVRDCIILIYTHVPIIHDTHVIVNFEFRFRDGKRSEYVFAPSAAYTMYGPHV